MARLVVHYGSKIETTIELDVARFVIGRGDEADLQVLNEMVSRQHCAIEADGTAHRVSDLGSTSGTFINGERLAVHTLAHGDRIELGKHSILYQRTSVERGLQPEVPADTSANTDFWQAGLAESKGDDSEEET